MATIVISNISYKNNFSNLHSWVQQIQYFLVKKIKIKQRKLIRKSSHYSTIKLAVPIVLVFVISAPIYSQGYYNIQGIHQVNMPNWFDSLDHVLLNLTSKNDSAVLFNTINDYFNFGNNSTNGLSNLLQYYPQFKTISLSSYIQTHNSVTDFIYLELFFIS